MFLSVMMAVSMAQAQHYDTEFGQNRIQYQTLEWDYISTNAFDVYYSRGGKEYAQEAVDYLEKEYPELTDKIGYAPYTKPKILIYNSIHELQQSNIGIGGDVYTIGGKTNFVKMQAEVAYSGQAHKFHSDLIYGISKILVTDMMYGGSLGEIFQNAYLLTLPEWFIDGAARYLAYGWSEDMDNYIRDFLGRKRIRSRLKVSDAEAGIVGQSIWNYIAIAYGESNLSNILNLTRIIRKEENGIANSLGVGYNDFLANWQNFYILQKEAVIVEYEGADKEDLISHKRNKELITTTVKINPMGNKVAYARIKNGQYYIYVKDLETEREQKIAWGGYRINDQEVDKYMPILDWQDAQTLGAVVFRRGNLYLDTYDIEKGSRNQKPLDRFRQIESFSFNDNGRLAIISGDIDGQNDLYLISMRRNSLRRITRDVYDDLDPVFIPGTSAIVFSSNRTNDSLVVKNVPMNDVTDNFNLFIYNLDTTKHSFFRLTNTYSTDRKPVAKNDYFIYYLSDQKGITNLYRFSLLDTTFSQVTAFDKGIQDFDLHFDKDAIAFMMLDKGAQKVYHNTTIDLDQDNFTQPTPRQNVKQSRFLFTRRNRQESGFTIEVEEPDSTQVFDPMEPDDFVFADEPLTPSQKVPPGYIDTDNYMFSDEIKEDYVPDSFFSNYEKMQLEIDRTGPFKYFPRFSFGNVTTSFANDPLRGFGFVLNTEVVDMMENYRVLAGGFFTQDFRQTDLFGEVQYLPYWTDFHFRVDRKTYKFSSFNSLNFHQYHLQNIEAGISVPVTHSFRGTLAPFYTRTTFNNLNPNAIIKSDPTLVQYELKDYTGIRASLVYDNTVEKGYNIFQGSRGLIEYHRYQPLSTNAQFFNKFEVDLRHYQKIHREITLAGRAYYGKFWGANDPKFLLGGVDNWLFARTINYEEKDPLFPTDAVTDSPSNLPNSNILFSEFTTNLRGFDYVQMFGSNAIVMNAELRIPIFRYFIRRPISSNFLRNFQYVRFYDMGTAWTGAPPFTRKNSFVEEEYPGYPFSGNFRNFRNPWLAGYGGGIRMSFLGYYLKIDRAKPIRDFKIGSPRWYISIGVDF